MMAIKNQREGHDFYELMFQRINARGLSTIDAAISVTEAYLDGRPSNSGKCNISQAERDELFWKSEFLVAVSANIYLTEPFVLALSRYMQQEKIANLKLLQQVVSKAPEAVRRAVRYSGLVLRQKSQRWSEIEQLGFVAKAEFGELIRICHTFDRAHCDRKAMVETHRKPLATLSPLELLSYASLYAFEHLVPKMQLRDGHEGSSETDFQQVWDAINCILLWKLQSTTDEAFLLTDVIIGASLRVHLSPFLFPSPTGSQIREDIYGAFGQLIAAQIELSSFLSQSVDAFCFDDTINFEFKGDELVIVERDLDAGDAWQRNGQKLARLHIYWLYRAVEKFAASELATVQIGQLENHEVNQFAYIKAIRTELQLTEVYGLDKSLTAESGLRVDVFQALLSLELMAAFFNKDFVRPYHEHLRKTGNWRSALTLLAMGGLAQSRPQNRFPFTWTERVAKIENIRPWTVSGDFPHGNAKAAEAILDFWTSDLYALSSRLRKDNKGLMSPELHERPVLKMGRYLFQFPWMVAMQNNSTSAINNLRRIGARRPETRDETQRIEKRLASIFKERGFHVCLNYQPARTIEDDPGEVDLICARDGYVLVLEIKSTFLRSSLKDAWLHKTVTLRKAGLQLRRKVEAVRAAIDADAKLALALGIAHGDVPYSFYGWIIDTSIEHDHEFFSGFLKVSLEEVLIALRDDRHLLNDPNGWLKDRAVDVNDDALLKAQATSRLYPDGFSGSHFIDVILRQSVWATSLEHG